MKAVAIVVTALVLLACDSSDYPRAECAIQTISRQHDSTFQRIRCDWTSDPYHKPDSTTDSIVGRKGK